MKDTLRGAIRELHEAGVPDAQASVEWIAEEVFDRTRAQIWAFPEEVDAGESRINAFVDMVERRKRREPVQHIVGKTAFMGLAFVTDSRALVPRPETEMLVEAVARAVEDLAAPRILDIGTGSGCIAVALAVGHPAARVVGVDVSSDALRLARQNARELNADVDFVEVDLFDRDFAAFGRPFDVVVSNPPYVPDDERGGLMPEVRDFEPPLALFSGEDPLRFYRRIAELLPDLLVLGGLIAVEVHPDYAERVRSLFEKSGLLDVAISRDLANRQRIVLGYAL